jgi:hypothetical protein
MPAIGVGAGVAVGLGDLPGFGVLCGFVDGAAWLAAADGDSAMLGAGALTLAAGLAPAMPPGGHVGAGVAVGSGAMLGAGDPPATSDAAAEGASDGAIEGASVGAADGAADSAGAASGISASRSSPWLTTVTAVVEPPAGSATTDPTTVATSDVMPQARITSQLSVTDGFFSRTVIWYGTSATLKSSRFVPEGTVGGSPKTLPSDGSIVNEMPGINALGSGVAAPGAPLAAGEPAAWLSGATLVAGVEADAWAAPRAATAIPPSTTAPE